MFQFKEPDVYGSEDCLWVNVYTPEIDDNSKLKPVLVWIYGGRWLVGTASSKFYSPDFMMDHTVFIIEDELKKNGGSFVTLYCLNPTRRDFGNRNISRRTEAP